MPLLLNTSHIEGPYSQITHNTGDEIDPKDYSARAAVAGIYKKGGRELLAHELIDQVDLDRKRDPESLPGLFSGGDGLLVVGPQVRDTILSYQTKGIQTWPVTLTHRNDPVADEPWFGLNVWLMIPSIDLEKSSHKISKGFGTTPRPSLKLRDKKVGLFADLPSDIHLWRDDQFPDSLLFSDKLAEAMLAVKNSLKGAVKFRTI